MPQWKGIIGQSFTPEAFKAYVASLNLPAGDWVPQFIVLHNTGIPTLAQYPNGITAQYIEDVVPYYRNAQPGVKPAWSAGPHLFVDDIQIWVFTPLSTSGVHSPSWNEISWGVEMLGDYDSEDFDSGRGLVVQQNAVAAIAILSAAVGIDPGTMRLHREDPGQRIIAPGTTWTKPPSSKRYGGTRYENLRTRSSVHHGPRGGVSCIPTRTRPATRLSVLATSSRKVRISLTRSPGNRP